MFGVKPRRAPVASPPAEPRMRGVGSAFVLDRVGWVLPVVAVATVAGVTLWQRASPRRDTPLGPSIVSHVPPDGPASVRGSVHAADPPEVEAPSGPGLLVAAREQGIAGAARAAALRDAALGSWSSPTDPRRIGAAGEAAALWRDLGQGERAISTLRSLLDALELKADARAERAVLLRELAITYDSLKRPRAAAGARDEAERLAPSTLGGR